VPSGDPSSTINKWNGCDKENTLRIIRSIFSISLKVGMMTKLSDKDFILKNEDK
jgi:hypothetical protein